MQLLKQYNFLIEKTMIVCSQDIGVYGMDQPFLPLAGLRVVEMSHMIMGPSCGMFMGFLGAEVIKVEQHDGDKTRYLLGMGRPMFPLFKRGKKYVQLDLKMDEGRAALGRLLETADVFVENLRDTSMAKTGGDTNEQRRRVA